MGLNNLGLGFTIGAEDAASAVFAKVGGALGGLSKTADKNKQEMGEVGAEMKKIGAALAGFGLAGIAGLGAAANAAGEFNQGIIETGTLVKHSQFSVAEMGELAKRMATTYGGDTSTQVKALYQAISAGATDAAKAQGLLDAANRLAIAGNADQATAVTGLTKILNNYGIEFSKASEVSDAFITAVQGGATTVGELGNSVGEVAASGKALGITYQELIGTLGTAATLTRDTAGATAGLKAVFSSIGHPSAEAAAEAKKLGIEFNAAAVRSKGFVGFLESITKNSKFSADTMQNLFGGSQEALNVMNSLATDGGKAMHDMMASMATNKGAAEGATAEMLAGPMKQFDIFKANAKVALIGIGEVVLPILGKVMGAVTGLLRSFNESPAVFKKFVAIGILVASVAAIVAGAVIALTGTILAAAAAGDAVLVALAASTGILELLAVAAVVGGVAIAGLKAAWENNIGGIRDYIVGLYDSAKLAWDGITQLFESGGFSGAVATEMGKAGNGGIRDFVIQVFMWGSRLQNFLKGISEGFGAAMGAMGPTFEAFKAALSAIGELFGVAKDGPTEAAASWQAWGERGAAIGGVVAGAIEWVVGAATTALQMIRALADGFKTSGPTATGVQKALDALGNALSVVATAFGMAGSSASGGGGGLVAFANAVGFVAGIIADVVVAATYALGPIFSFIASAFSAVAGVVSGVAGVIGGTVNLVVGLLSGDWAQAWLGAKQIVFGQVKAIISVITLLVSAIAGQFDAIGRLFGKDLGLQKAVEGGKQNLLRDLQKGMGLDKPSAGAPPVAPPKSQTLPAPKPGDPMYRPLANEAAPGAPSAVAAARAPTATPAVGGVAPATSPAAAAAGAAPPAPDVGAQVAAAIKAQPPAQVTTNLTVQATVNEGVLFEVVEKAKGSASSRGLGPSPTAT
jgi:TP901 family phage tail tape measure protein